MARPDRENLKRIFDRDPELYDRARPGYPERLFDDLLTLAGLEPGEAVLEIGCGTGQATRPLARRGCRLVCLEIGEGLARVARRNLAPFPQVEVISSAFEAWEPQGAVFRMVFAATSWHWLDPSVRYAKAASVLEPGAALAIVSGGHAFPEGFDSFFTEIQECYDAIGEGAGKWPPPRPEEVVDERADIDGSGLFGDVRVRRYLWAMDYTAGNTLTCSIRIQGTVPWSLQSARHSTPRSGSESRHGQEAVSASTTSTFSMSPDCCSGIDDAFWRRHALRSPSRELGKAARFGLNIENATQLLFPYSTTPRPMSPKVRHDHVEPNAPTSFALAARGRKRVTWQPRVGSFRGPEALSSLPCIGVPVLARITAASAWQRCHPATF